MAFPVSTDELRAGVPQAASAALSATGHRIREFLRLSLSTTAGRIGLPIVAIHLIVAIFGPLFAPYPATEFHLFPYFPKEHQLAGPSLDRDFISIANATPRVDATLDLTSASLVGLDDNFISENLRTGLRENKVDLSNSATVSTQQAGSFWLVTDPEAATTYMLVRQGELNSIKVRNSESRTNFALSLSSDTQEGLDNSLIQEGLESGVLSNNLRTQFSDQKLDLSNDATVSTLEDGSSWLITNQDPLASYIVTRGDERYLLGTDQYGRDVFSRVLSGAGSLISISLSGAVLGIFLGTVVGMACGYKGGKIDELIMRVMDGIMAFPSLLLALLILSTLGAREAPWGWLEAYWEPVLIVATVGVVFTPGVARVMRALTLKAKNLEFVMSARLRGESSTYIIFREILPNAMTVLAVELAVKLSYSILIVSSLGFLGLGVQPPSPDWGLMIGESRQFIASAPWMTLAPAGAVASLVVGVNLLTDGIKQASGLPREAASV